MFLWFGVFLPFVHFQRGNYYCSILFPMLCSLCNHRITQATEYVICPVCRSNFHSLHIPGVDTNDDFYNGDPRTDWISFNYITELRFGWYHPIPRAGAADTQPQWLLMNDISLTLQTPFLVVFGSIPCTRAGDGRGVARNLWCGQFLLCRASRL